MIYKREDIQHFMKDVKSYVKAPYKPNWCIVVDDNNEEYHDEDFWITDGFALWLLPSDRPTRFRMEYEEDINKMKTKGLVARRPNIRSIRRFKVPLDNYVEATEFGLHFHPRTGFSVEGRAGDHFSRLDMRFLYAFEDMLRNVPELEDYRMYIHGEKDMQVVALGVENNVRAYIAPLSQEAVPYD